MQSTLKTKPADDPHDVLVVAPDLVRVAPVEAEVSSLLREAARQHSVPQAKAAPDRAAGVAVPPVDTTFRAAAVDDLRRPVGRWAWRGFAALLLVACLGGASVAWQAYGDAAKALIATSVPNFLTSLLPAQKPEVSVKQPAVETEAADAAPAQATPAQPAPPSQATPDAVAPAAAAAPSPESAQSVQSMARDIASLTQQVEALKAGIDELKAGQQHISRDVAKAAEQNARPRTAKLSASPPRPIARPRQPMPIYQPAYPPPQAQMAPPQPAAPYPATAPYYAPRQAESPPRAVAAPQDEPETSTVPRPPMPVR